MTSLTKHTDQVIQASGPGRFKIFPFFLCPGPAFIVPLFQCLFLHGRWGQCFLLGNDVLRRRCLDGRVYSSICLGKVFAALCCGRQASCSGLRGRLLRCGLGTGCNLLGRRGALSSYLWRCRTTCHRAALTFICICGRHWWPGWLNLRLKLLPGLANISQIHCGAAYRRGGHFTLVCGLDGLELLLSHAGRCLCCLKPLWVISALGQAVGSEVGKCLLGFGGGSIHFAASGVANNASRFKRKPCRNACQPTTSHQGLLRLWLGLGNVFRRGSRLWTLRHLLLSLLLLHGLRSHQSSLLLNLLLHAGSLALSAAHHVLHALVYLHLGLQRAGCNPWGNDARIEAVGVLLQLRNGQIVGKGLCFYEVHFLALCGGCAASHAKTRQGLIQRTQTSNLAADF